MPEDATAPPPETFNIAEHLIALNAGRPEKPAFVDDARTLTYGDLAERVRWVAAALRAAGIKREERVLVLMLDTVDWPVAFLGALYAGAVPVAVNTLLTADDYAYMLEHSRAQAVFVSGDLKGVLKGALTKSDHEVHKVIVSRPTSPLEFGETDFETFVEVRARYCAPPQRAPMNRRSGSIRPAPPGSPRAPCIRMPIRIGRWSFMAGESCACAKTTSASPPPNCSSPMVSATR